MTLIRSVLSDHLKTVYRNLSAGAAKPVLIMATLRLLIAMVGFHPTSTREVAAVFEFGLKVN